MLCSKVTVRVSALASQARRPRRSRTVLCCANGPVAMKLCQTAKSSPRYRLVNVAPGEEAQPASECGASLGLEAVQEGGGLAHNAVSENGSRVFFTAPDPAAANKGKGCWNGSTAEEEGQAPVNAPQLYARIETGEGSHEVLEVSAPEEGVKEAGHAPVRYPAIYTGASTDGSKVFFLTRTELTAEAATLKLHDSGAL